MKIPIHKQRGVVTFYNGSNHSTSRPPSPSPTQTDDFSETLNHQKKQTFESLIDNQMLRINKQYKRYIMRKDMLKTHKQKLLAICRLRKSNYRVWVQSRGRLTKFLADKEMRDLASTKLGRKYMEKYYLAAIWAIDRLQFKKMVEDFNKTIKHKSTKPLKEKDFFDYILNSPK